MTAIQFEERAVAFIDVLGFSQLVDRACQSQSEKLKLQSLVDLLGSTIPVLDGGVSATVPLSDIPKHIYISDSLILSAPFSSQQPSSYDGLSTVVMRCIQVTQLFLEEGYLVRGGIDVGQVWHSTFNIVGPAYQCAYRVQRERQNPGIELSETAGTRWGAGHLSQSKMCVQYDGHLIVNGLDSWYFQDAASHGGIERAYQRFEDRIQSNLNANLATGPREKWEWFQRALAAARK